MEIKFTKMHGIGNNYIYVNGFQYQIPDPGRFSAMISDKNYGVGSDGLILILPSETCDFKMRMYNADGSEGKMCGNGIRCLGKYVFEHQMTDKTSLTVETRGGIKTLDLIIENDQVAYVKVDMGKPELKAPNIPVVCENDHFINQPVMVLGKEYAATAVSMGNPHCVIFMKNIESLNLKDIGPFFENQKIFPDRVNTEFAEVISPTLIKMRVWERGSGETQACGTGACAAAVAACLNGISKQGTDITVKLAGGDLNIRWEKDQTVYMKGPASFIFEGTITI